MINLKIGDKAPNIELKTDGNQIFSLAELTGKNCVIYFYPKDDTPGCTLEAQDFTELYAEFKEKLGLWLVSGRIEWFMFGNIESKDSLEIFHK